MSKGNTKRLTFCALMTALSLLLLFLGVLLPGGDMAMCALAGLPVAAAVIRYDLGAGALTFAASGLLALLVLPDKGIALFYVLVFGAYALLKSLIERLHRLLWEWALKLAYGSAVTALFVFVLPEVLAGQAEIPPWAPALLFFGILAVFVLYDLALSRLLTSFAHRIRGK